MTDAILSCEHVSRSFGGVRAVVDASLEIERGTVTGLIGPNGAGKSTLVNVISGHIRPEDGTVRFNGQDITGLPPYRVARTGLIRTFQLSSEFPWMTLLENMLVAPKQIGTSFGRAIFNRRSWIDEEYRLLAKAREYLQSFGLGALENEYAGNLSGGQKRLLEIARALMAEPEMLVLDEPMAGVAGVLIDRIVDHILELGRSGLTFLVIEHDLEVVDRLCETVYAMAQGSVLSRGTMAELRQDERVLEAYLD
ncbi:MAG TPA: ABC transporter ATP-binding protein [Acidimicrobiales bacterium]|nr:ABC transporter ATP-binding protein [Acidimicrobiales bacterium]